MGYAERAPYESSVDWANLEKKELYIRDRKLSSLVESSDFVDAIFHMWLHKSPSENEKKMLHSVLVSFCGGWSIIPRLFSPLSAPSHTYWNASMVFPDPGVPEISIWSPAGNPPGRMGSSAENRLSFI